MNTTTNACFARATQVWLAVNYNISVMIRSILHGQVSLAAVRQIHVFYEAICGCKNLKIH